LIVCGYLRSALKSYIHDVSEKSVRYTALNALLYNYPDERVLTDPRNTADWRAAEEFCIKNLGAVFDGPTPEITPDQAYPTNIRPIQSEDNWPTRSHQWPVLGGHLMLVVGTYQDTVAYRRSYTFYFKEAKQEAWYQTPVFNKKGLPEVEWDSASGDDATLADAFVAARRVAFTSLPPTREWTKVTRKKATTLAATLATIGR
jgi:hypothetical protein